MRLSLILLTCSFPTNVATASVSDTEQPPPAYLRRLQTGTCVGGRAAGLHCTQNKQCSGQGKCEFEEEPLTSRQSSTELCGTCAENSSISCTSNDDCPLAATSLCDVNTTGGAGANNPCSSDKDCEPNKGRRDQRGSCVRSETVCNLQTCAPTTPPTQNPTRSPSPPAPVVSFYAIGDVPYSPLEECLLPFELGKITHDMTDQKFMIHLGDIRDGQRDPNNGSITDCPETLHEGVARIFEKSPVPTFFVMGDNGWLDCADADESYSFWREHLFPFNERQDLNWPSLEATVTRHATTPELFEFLLDGVLFLGQSLPGSGKDLVHEWSVDWDSYMYINSEWTKDRLAANADATNAVVIFGHSMHSQNEIYFTELEKVVRQHPDIPFLFLEDAHVFDLTQTFLAIDPVPSNLYRVALDDTVTPTTITVSPSAPSGALSDVFTLDRGCPCSTDHRPTKLITYSSSGCCSGKCEEAHAACIGEESCSPEGNEDLCSGRATQCYGHSCGPSGNDRAWLSCNTDTPY